MQLCGSCSVFCSSSMLEAPQEFWNFWIFESFKTHDSPRVTWFLTICSRLHSRMSRIRTFIQCRERREYAEWRLMRFAFWLYVWRWLFEELSFMNIANNYIIICTTNFLMVVRVVVDFTTRSLVSCLLGGYTSKWMQTSFLAIWSLWICKIR